MGQHIRTQEKAGIMALHEVNLATCYCTHCLMLFGDGQWMAGPTEELLTTTNLSRLYDCRIRLVDDGEQQVFAVGA
jgi:iron complex transport system ATP-binding protein